ncbi:cell division protein PerM, partial [Streptomyces synnematoformans]|uniref:cell division protein PerM n=1 Tax=Streptomyces synnematoformans TaxID=415721 RepID=UPI0031D2FA07
RAAAAGVVALLGGGALLCAVALVMHAAAAQEHFLSLSATVSGRFGVFLLAVALLPNAAVWAAAYGLGPGFAVGAGSAVTPLGAADYPVQPVFPLLAAVPGEGPGGPLTWAAAAVPVAAGIVVGCFAGRAAAPLPGEREQSWRWWPTVGVTALAALGCGAGTAALAWLAGGPLGTETLADFGPVWWRAGGAAVAWTAVVGVPSAVGSASGRS